MVAMCFPKDEYEQRWAKVLANMKKQGFDVAVVWGRSADATLLDPADVTDGESVMVVTNLFDTLVSFKRGSTEIEPSLATSQRFTPLADPGLQSRHAIFDNALHKLCD